MRGISGVLIRRAEIVSALSHALDITEGQPEGHGVRCAYTGMAIGTSPWL